MSSNNIFCKCSTTHKQDYKKNKTYRLLAYARQKCHQIDTDWAKHDLSLETTMEYDYAVMDFFLTWDDDTFFIIYILVYFTRCVRFQ